MQELFGIPMGPLAAVLVGLLAAAIGILAALALRNRVFFRLGVRNIPRRPGRTALIVVGLMLATTIITSALATGDTMSTTVRSSVLHMYGQTDELISIRGADADQRVDLGQAASVEYFDEGLYPQIAHTLYGTGLVDGVAPAIAEPVAMQDVRSRQNEPRVALFATDPHTTAGFGEIRADGKTLSLGDLGPGQLYINRDAADELDARAGDFVRVFAARHVFAGRVKAIVDYDGAGTDSSAVLLPLDRAQTLLERPGEIKHVLVSNRGGPTSGAELTKRVERAVKADIGLLGLEISPVKQDGLDVADEQGSMFMSIFTTFGSFSIVAGVLLIFLIFVMLAAERRSELGIARAVGTRRGHLVQMYVFEGVAYDLAAAAVGALLGIGVALAMVSVMASAFGQEGLELVYSVRARSVVVAYALGVLLTLVVVAVSAWRVSVLNIVAAVRNLPDVRARKTGRRRWIFSALALVLGVVLVFQGIAGGQMMPFGLGFSLALIGATSLARTAGVDDRLAYTVGGLLLVVFWLLPFDALDWLVGDMGMNFSVWIVSGLMVVIGATWVLMYNADVLLGLVMAVFGRVRAAAPVLKLAMAYPLRNRFRTGVTLAMFTLVVFTVVVGATTSGSFLHAADNKEMFGGGFDVRAEVAPASPIRDIGYAVRRSPQLHGDFTVAASQSFLPAELRQGRSGTFEDYQLRGLDGPFLRNTTFGLGAIARGYHSNGAVWRALASRRGLAVVDALVVPHRAQFGFEAPPDFQVHGFYVEDKTFAPFTVAARDPQTGRRTTLKVIGVLQDSAPYAMAGVLTSQATLEAAFGDRATPTVYYFKTAPGVDPDTVARRLESVFLANGMQADSIRKVLHEAVSASWTMNRLILAFMGLGLIVGVAALGVISARSVVERRQQIGVLRAIGFQRRMVQASFLLEASFIALTAIVVGTALGLMVAYNVVADSASQGTWGDNLELSIRWATLGVVFLTVYAAALLTTLAPALRASRVYPAEALRYE
jgi:putative ABC transport system permease protein